MDDEVSRVVERELALLDPQVRRDPARVRALLHPDYVEFGASGRVWDRSSVVGATAGGAGATAGGGGATAGGAEVIEALDLQPRRLGDGVVLLTYRARTDGRETLRSSTWIRDEAAGWLLVFHQGTPAA